DPLESAVTRFKEFFRKYPVEATSIENAVASDILCTVTPAREPVVKSEWIVPGTHINAIGTLYPDRREVDSVCVQRSRVIVDSRERALKEEGEVLIPIREGLLKPQHIYGELGEIVAGVKGGRTNEEEITLFLSGAISIEYVAV
ncbi:MAG: ornithine cyclodeaminase family protein, partial [Pseudomonadota bacterium]